MFFNHWNNFLLPEMIRIERPCLLQNRLENRRLSQSLRPGLWTSFGTPQNLQLKHSEDTKFIGNDKDSNSAELDKLIGRRGRNWSILIGFSWFKRHFKANWTKKSMKIKVFASSSIFYAHHIWYKLSISEIQNHSLIWYLQYLVPSNSHRTLQIEAPSSHANTIR